MEAPNVAFIEIAKDNLKTRDPFIVQSEAKELHSLGPVRMQEVKDCTPGGDPMLAGYLLGLETARVLLAHNRDAVVAGVTF